MWSDQESLAIVQKFKTKKKYYTEILFISFSAVLQNTSRQHMETCKYLMKYLFLALLEQIYVYCFVFCKNLT